MRITQDLLDFIDGSVSPFHSAALAEELLLGRGFTRLRETDAWTLTPGGKYYIRRNGSSLIAFRYPGPDFRGFLISAAHGDSPAFKLKPNCGARKDGYVCAGVEKYGGMLCQPWYDRPLGVAGRVTVRTEKGAALRRVNVDRDVMIIPSLPIHLDDQANSAARTNPQTDMQPILGSAAAEGGLFRLIGESLGVDPGDILSSDLYLYPRQKGTVVGVEGEYLCAPRLDDLMCAYTTLTAFLDSENDGMVTVCALFDSEEVGSNTRQGADSDMLLYLLRRIAGDGEGLCRALDASFVVSADNAHAIHPNHPEKYDRANCCVMNGGVVIKHTAGSSYATDAYSAAVFKAVCDRAGVPTQVYANRSDIRGGRTLGNISNGHVSVHTVDVGLAQLAMHSCYETAGAKDAGYMIDAMRAFFTCNYRVTDEGFEI